MMSTPRIIQLLQAIESGKAVCFSKPFVDQAQTYPKGHKVLDTLFLLHALYCGAILEVVPEPRRIWRPTFSNRVDPYYQTKEECEENNRLVPGFVKAVEFREVIES